MSRRPQIISEATEYYERLYNDSTVREKDEDQTLKETDSIVLTIPESELELAIRKQKDDKTPGEDSISNEILKALLEPLQASLRILFDRILEKKIIPYQWTTSTIMLLHKNVIKMT